jgi:endo-1,4-beta-xylanase
MKKNVLFLIAFCFITLVACKDKVTPVDPVPTGEVTLASAAPFKVGCSVDPNLLKNNALYKGVVLKEYNSITAENAMKWGSLRPNASTFNFNDADYIVDLATTNNKRVFGHVLVWHAYNPTWLETSTADSATFEGILKTHIQTVMGRYKGKIAAWDVVNEAFEDNGSLRTSSIWYKKLGPDYIARAFKYAKEADPSALLFYNDYGQEYAKAKLQGITTMVADFKKRGIPIDGIGLQMHMSINTDENGLLTAISETAKTGLKVHISELDINLTNNTKNANLTFTAELAATQKEKYRNVVRYYKGIVPATQQFGITNWNVGDADSWLRSTIQKNEYPLLFDEKYEKKPAYFGYIDGLK